MRDLESGRGKTGSETLARSVDVDGEKECCIEDELLSIILSLSRNAKRICDAGKVGCRSWRGA